MSVMVGSGFVTIIIYSTGGGGNVTPTIVGILTEDGSTLLAEDGSTLQVE